MLSCMARHWRGEYSLGVSLWLISVVTFMLLRAMGTEIISPAIKNSFDPLYGLMLATAYVLLTLVFTLWHGTGTWRAARKHKVRRWRKSWPGAAIAILVLLIAVSAKCCERLKTMVLLITLL